MSTIVFGLSALTSLVRHHLPCCSQRDGLENNLMAFFLLYPSSLSLSRVRTRIFVFSPAWLALDRSSQLGSLGAEGRWTWRGATNTLSTGIFSFPSNSWVFVSTTRMLERLYLSSKSIYIVVPLSRTICFSCCGPIGPERGNVESRRSQATLLCLLEYSLEDVRLSDN